MQTPSKFPVRRRMLALVGGLVIASSALAAEPFPSKPLSLIIPYAAGSQPMPSAVFSRNR